MVPMKSSDTCNKCGREFVPDPAKKNVACLVYHPEGDCCHYNQIEVKRAPKPSATVRDILEKWRIETADIIVNPETPGLREAFSLYDQEGFINELFQLIEKEVIGRTNFTEHPDSYDKTLILRTRSKLQKEQRQALKRLFSKDLGDKSQSINKEERDV